MASANKVRQGQVWTAKVSGKAVQVEILGESGATGSGRKKFQFRNLSTGRTATGTAGKLKTMVSAGTSRLAPGASAPPAPVAPLPKRSAPKRPSPFAPRAEAPAPTSSPNPPPVTFRPFTPKPIVREAIQSAPVAVPSIPSRGLSSSLGSLRGNVHFDPSARPHVSLSNPSRYPSEAARSAAQALSSSSATDPDQVMAVMQAWYQRMVAEATHAESMQRYYPPFLPY